MTLGNKSGGKSAPVKCYSTGNVLLGKQFGILKELKGVGKTHNIEQVEDQEW